MDTMRRYLPLVLIALVAAIGLLQLQEPDSGVPAEPGSAPETAQSAPAARRYPGFLPAEAIATLELIEQGGPYPYRQDGSVFQNREGLLPDRPRGYYREYTVPTPGARDRGARRFVVGGDPPAVWYYTADHYRSFRPVEVRP